jgi:NADH dehydrogenase FAD-containing subunit
MRKIQISHARYLDLRLATVLHDTAVSISRDVHSLELASGKKLEFDALVLATGSSYAKPIKTSPDDRVWMASRGDTLASAHQGLSRAKTVLVIGGGIVGVELAAEIAVHFSRIKVLIIHSGKRLMGSSAHMPERASAYCDRQLKAMGVEVMLRCAACAH